MSWTLFLVYNDSSDAAVIAALGWGSYLVASAQEEGSHGGGQAHAHRAHVRPHVPHGVKHRHARRHGATGRVHIHGDVLLGGGRIQVQELSLRVQQPPSLLPEYRS